MVLIDCVQHLIVAGQGILELNLAQTALADRDVAQCVPNKALTVLLLQTLEKYSREKIKSGILNTVFSLNLGANDFALQPCKIMGFSLGENSDKSLLTI